MWKSPNSVEWKEWTSQGCWMVEGHYKGVRAGWSLDKIDVTINKMMRVLRKIPNWKASGPDNGKLLVHLQDCLDSGVVPDWLTKGQIVLTQKDKAKGNIASNYQPVTYLPLLWKLLTGILVDEIYDYLENVTGRRNEEV